MEETLFHKDKLKAIDYISNPVTELMKHKDYSPHAMRVVNAILDMTTEQLEQLTIARGPH